MRIGKLRMRATIRRPIAEDDRYGQETGADVDAGVYWCEELATAAIERLLGAQAIAEAAKALRFRGRIDLRPGDRLVIAGRSIEVAAVMNPDGRRIETVAVGKERQPP